VPYINPLFVYFSNFNTNPVGSGPFKIKKIEYNSSGIPTLYDLRSYNNYTLGRPFINKLLVYFYANQEDLLRAYASGTVTSLSAVSSSILNEYLSENSELLRVAFPRIFAIFFNQNKNHLFSDKDVRLALEAFLDKERIVREVLNGYGTVIDSPLPPETVRGQKTAVTTAMSDKNRHDRGVKMLEDAGWEFDQELNSWSDGEQLLFRRPE